MMSLLIKGGDILDGQKTPPRRADVLVVGDRIAALGDLSSYKADQVIDLAPGSYVAPGFIGFGAQSDKRLTLFSDTVQEDILLQGNTTEIFGTGGISLAPTLYGELDLISSFRGIRAINVNWHSIQNLLDNIQNLQLGINFGTLAGYETIRHSILGRDRSMGASEVGMVKLMVQKAIDDGALGISMLVDQHNGNIGQEEKKDLYDLVLQTNKLLEVKLKRVGVKNEAILAGLIQAVKSGVKMIISSLYLSDNSDWQKNLNTVNELTPSGILAFSVFPYKYAEMTFKDLLPDIKTANPYLVAKELLKTRNFQLFSKNILKYDADDFWITDAPSHSYLYGMSLKEFAVNHNLDIPNALIKLYEISKGKIVFYAPLVSEDTLKQALFNPHAIISSGWSPMKNVSKIHGELSLWNERFLSYASASNGLSIEDAVYKLSGYPAKILGLKERGVLKEGAIADITIFKDHRIASVLVSGKIAVKDGVITAEKGGKIIKNV